MSASRTPSNQWRCQSISMSTPSVVGSRAHKLSRNSRHCSTLVLGTPTSDHRPSWLRSIRTIKLGSQRTRSLTWEPMANHSMELWREKVLKPDGSSCISVIVSSRGRPTVFIGHTNLWVTSVSMVCSISPHPSSRLRSPHSMDITLELLLTSERDPS